MAKRRHNGEGTIVQRPGGTWQGRLSYVDPVTGHRKRTSIDGPTAAAVQAKMKTTRERLQAGAPPKDAARTVSNWLSHWRRTTLAASGRKPSTIENYSTLSKSHLETGVFCNITLDKLRPSDIDALVLTLRGKGLAASSVHSVYSVLRSALDAAVRDQLLAHNPVAAVKRPGVPRREAAHLDAAGVTKLLAAADQSRHHCALVVIASTGLRRGEVLALHWRDVDLDAGVLTVRGTAARVNGKLTISPPKTTRSR
jgi:integrase